MKIDERDRKKVSNIWADNDTQRTLATAGALSTSHRQQCLRTGRKPARRSGEQTEVFRNSYQDPGNGFGGLIRIRENAQI